MKALCWHGTHHVSVDTVDDPRPENPRDAIVKVTATAICGSDLHLYDGYVPMMEDGDVLGHEFMGEVVEVGSAVPNLAVGDRVVVPFAIACGQCFFCKRGLYSLCDESNPNAATAAKQLGHSPAGLFGYSHLMGGFPGGQAEYVRVPFADVGPLKIESDLRDDQVLFLTDIFPTGYMAAEHCAMEGGETVAVWGCGPVGQFTIKCAWMLGAGRVIAIDHVAERLHMAHVQGPAETIDFGEVDVYDRLQELTHGRGPDCCVDAVGCEANAHGMIRSAVSKVKEAGRMPGNKVEVLAEAIKCCRKGGVVSIPGVYTSTLDSFPAVAMMNKGLTLRTGQTHVQRYMRPLLQKIEAGDIDPSFIITHQMKLEQAPSAYKTFRDHADGCVKVVLTP